MNAAVVSVNVTVQRLFFCVIFCCECFLRIKRILRNFAVYR